MDLKFEYSEKEETMRPIRVGEITGLWSYLKTIDWSEPWFIGLGIFHLTCILITILTRRKGTLQCGYFICLLMLVYFSETINTMAAQNWKRFARQQYFDSQGLFISVVFSSPLLFNCLVMVILWLYNAGTLLVEVKKVKLARAARSRQKEAEKKTE